MPGTDRSKRRVERDARITCKPVANGFANSGEVFLFLGQCLDRSRSNSSSDAYFPDDICAN